MTISANDLSKLTDWQHGQISPKIFVDEEIYRLEMERLFGRTWQFICPDSQIPRPGDFFNTYMGEDPVIAVRQRDGGIKVLLNACRHRGMKVCRADMGNIKAFTCTYHGWTYDTAGNLVNVPNLEDAYYNDLPTERLGLIEVAQVDDYKGLVFANFDPTAPSLREYLGDMTWYLDTFLDRREGGIEARGVHKITFKGNWKLAAEQFASDNYHASMTHISASRVWSPDGQFADVHYRTTGYDGRQVTFPHGHGMAGFRIDTREDMAQFYRARGQGEIGDYIDRNQAEIDERLGPDRPMYPVATVFPNLSIRASGSLGCWHPKGPHAFEAVRFGFVDAAATPEEKEVLLRLDQESTLALIEADDGENWSEMSRNMARSPQVQRMPLNYQMGLGHPGRHDDTYPGIVIDRSISEFAGRNFFRRWLEFMVTTEAWPEPDTEGLYSMAYPSSTYSERQDVREVARANPR